MLKIRHWTALTLTVGLLGASVAAPAPVSAASIVVGPGGFATIQQAVNNAAPGTAIVIAPGSYAENVDLSAMGSSTGAGTGDLALVARDGAGTVTLSGSGVKLNASAAFEGSLIVDGLTLSSSDEDTLRLGSFTNLVVVNSTFQTIGNDNGDSAVEISIIAGDPHIVLLNNTFALGTGTTTAVGSAVLVDATGSAAPIITVQDNTLSEPDRRPLSFPRLFFTLLGAGGTIAIRDNTFSNILSGILVQLGEEGDKAVTISDNLMTGLQSVAIDVKAAPGGAVDATIANNRVSGVAASAITLETNAAVSANITGNQISDLVGSGIIAGARGAVTSDVDANLALQGNVITRAGRSGISLLAAGASTINALVRNNRVDQPATLGVGADSALVAASTPTGNLTLAISENTLGADSLSRSALLSQQTGSVTRIEGDSAASVEQNVTGANTLGGAVAVAGSIGIVAPGTVTPPLAAAALAVEDDLERADPGASTTLDVLENDTGGSAPELAFVVPVSRLGASLSGTSAVTYTAPAGFVGSDVAYYVASVGQLTGVGRISVNVSRAVPGTPRSLTQLRFLPLVGKAP